MDPLTRTPAKRWGGLTLQGAPEAVPMGTVSPVVAHAESLTQSKRSILPYLIGIGMGIAACVAFLLFLGKGTVTAVQPLAAAPEVVRLDAGPAAELTPPPAPAPEVVPIPSPPPTLQPAHAGVRPASDVIKARVAAPGHRAPKKAPSHTENPFNGSY